MIVFWEIVKVFLVGVAAILGCILAAIAILMPLMYLESRFNWKTPRCPRWLEYIGTTMLLIILIMGIGAAILK